MGEKFAANPVTGTGSMTVPIATSPGRSGFGPEISLSYDSGAGNGPFGFGWSLSLPSISRKTDKGLPQYRDAEESDLFILSGAEDLVPVLEKKNGKWQRQVLPQRTVDGKKYNIQRYRPRVEGLFARIERWTRIGSQSDIHWRTISMDNILTIYGLDGNSRIADPLDPSRIFSWLICETRDDKGDAVLYRYKAEDGQGIKLDQAHERNRGPQDDVRRRANRYIKRIYYGNRTSLLDDAGNRPPFLDNAEIDRQIAKADWMFEVVFDYDDHDPSSPEPSDDEALDGSALKYPWKPRQDPFSSYRSGFEVRTARLCQRVLMFHHFPDEPEVGKDCLVRSTDFTYAYEQAPNSACNPVYTFLHEVTQNGYKRNNGGYIKRSLPPVEFEYTKPAVQDTVEEVDSVSRENLPAGLDGSIWQWTDLHGEGIFGIITEQANAWFYKRNLSPIPGKTEGGQERIQARFAALEKVAVKPNLALAASAQFMDLAGDGQPDLVVLGGPQPGLYEHDAAEGWQPFRPFTSRLNRDLHDPNTKLIDLNGDGHADVLVTEDNAFVWHASLAEEGFGPARRVAQALDEENGPRLVFADGTQSIYTADLSGDGLSDLVRIRNGEVCYWPNLGYCRFGAKITMDNAPWFDQPDQFDQKRIRLADIDGSGTTDIIYLHRDAVSLYFNQSGNSWSKPQVLKVFPRVDDLVSIVPVDLLGNGTACLVWSTSLPGDTTRPMRYVNLMGGQKPHLLVKTANNLGAETRVHYAPSTKFYLQDKYNGKPWITRLPFPVHVVERVETIDHISRNCFVTRYAYHHGYFDGEEREFRGFGMVEQWDTEEIGSFALEKGEGRGDEATNWDAASDVPPVLTRTWFHTGVYLGREHVSDFFAGLLNGNDKGEYYREPGLKDTEARRLLLPDTVLPDGLTTKEAREACRALKGMMLRQEVYAQDGTDKEKIPYTLTEQNSSIRVVQRLGKNRHAVFFAHPREALTYHYERNTNAPRTSHAMTLEVDDFGNVLRSLAIAYGRRRGQTTLHGTDKEKQEQTLITYTENRVTHAIDDSIRNPNGAVKHPDDYRAPLAAEVRTFEVTGYDLINGDVHLGFDKFTEQNFKALTADLSEIEYQEPPDYSKKQRRLIEHVRTYYRPDDLGKSANDPNTLLPLGGLQSKALPGETYTLAFTPGLAKKIYVDSGKVSQPELNTLLANEGGYVHTEGDDHWWIPSGRMLYSPDSNHSSLQEWEVAIKHFFLPRRYCDPFDSDSFVDYDRYDLLVMETRDALGNRVTAGEREHVLPDGSKLPEKNGIDYRVLQPCLMMDPNRNRSAVAFDALGLVVGTAVMGKPEQNVGDSLTGFGADLSDAERLGHLKDPLMAPHTILQKATTRLVYDLFAYKQTKDNPHPQPAVVSTLARETHENALVPGEQTRIQHSLTYSDGFGREIQKKIQAESGPVPLRNDEGKIILDANGLPKMTANDDSPRWVGSGWTVFNNKGKPVRQYEPFFTDTHHFEFEPKIGVSPILFYDPLGRVVATLYPNHTWEKVIFDPWWQETWDVNDTVLKDPAQDLEVGNFFKRLPQDDYLPTWHALRTDSAHVVAFKARYPDAKDRDNETSSAKKAAAHTDTTSVAHLDTLGRTFLTVAQNKVVCPDHDLDGKEEEIQTRVELDIEGNQRAVRDGVKKAFDAQGNEVEDPLGRIVMQYDYDIAGPEESEEEDEEDEDQKPIHQISMEAGERWTLFDVAGNLIRAWDSRGFKRRMTYDELRRPIALYVTESGVERLSEKTVYGENLGDAANHRGQVYQQFDQAGTVTQEQYDFKGNSLKSSRQIQPAYKQAIDWKTMQPKGEIFFSSTTFDALNRPITAVTPDGSITRYTYNEANLLDRTDVALRGATSNGEPDWTPFVTNIDCDAKGQRSRIDYGNGVSTFYEYDPLTYRLVHLMTRRNDTSYPDDCPQSPDPDWPGCGVQNLHYSYDPAGNITHIRDEAQQTIFFRNKRVEPSAEYTYDALYRLIQATGREHLGQNNKPIPHSHDDALRTNLPQPQPSDRQALGRYIERYVYDEVGNFLKMQHHRSDEANSGWTRTYAYCEASLIENGSEAELIKVSNRLSRTILGNGTSTIEPYTHDPHGNMTSMPHLAQMEWDFEDQLQSVDLGGGGTAFYVYDASGERVRKVIEQQNGTLKEERIYLGGFEIYRKYNANGNAVVLERETLHVMDDQQRIALVESKTVDINHDPSPKELIRYQLGNHLGSASVELDKDGRVISYEEYSPYGSTVYQAVDKAIKAAAKRYRYTGGERDEESGLNYHGARFYALWLGRWTSYDPMYLEYPKSESPYLYSANSPISFVDPDGLKEFDINNLRTLSLGRDTRAKQYIQNLNKHYTREVGRLESERLGNDALTGKQRVRIHQQIGTDAMESTRNYAKRLLNDPKYKGIQIETSENRLKTKYSSGRYSHPRRIDLEVRSGKSLYTIEFKKTWTKLTSSSRAGKQLVAALNNLVDRAKFWKRAAHIVISANERPLYFRASDYRNISTKGLWVKSSPKGRRPAKLRGGMAVDVLQLGSVIAEKTGIAELSGLEAFKKGPGVFAVRLAHEMWMNAKRIPSLPGQALRAATNVIAGSSSSAQGPDLGVGCSRMLYPSDCAR
ncbi:MAG: FG-GAP-like repeat-containing protein [Candidatus Thiodiazotropha taylori]|nr:FG-GAP-like repeat-containing protein [Candidatus Thiodiazotropha taylori]